MAYINPNAPIPEAFQMSLPIRTTLPPRGRNGLEIPANVPQGPQADERDDMRLDSGDESDGGVALESGGPVSVAPESLPFIPPNSPLYIQDLSVLSHATDSLWRPPVPTSEVQTPGQMKNLGRSGTFAEMHLYARCCKLIKKAWGCGLEDCIPTDMRHMTLYSLALLHQIRKLAKNYPKNMPAAHALLVLVWRQRVETLTNDLAPGSLQLVWTLAVRPPNPANGTDRIQENVYGLTVADATRAANGAPKKQKDGANLRHVEASLRKSNRKKLRSQARERQAGVTSPENTNVELPGSAIAAAVAQRRREERENKFAPLKDLQPEITQYYPVDNSNNIEQRANSKPSPITPTHITFAAPLRISHTQPAPLNKPAKRNAKERKPRHKALNSQMKFFEIDNERDVRPHREKQLLAGGESRRLGPRDARMPSERFDLNSVPTLHEMAMAGATSHDQLAKMGQQALPD